MILLMVDDEPIIIQTLARSISIESLNIEKILLAYSAEDAKRYFLNEPMIDLVMCDIEMPQTNGLALLSWIRANYPQTGCVFVTNYSVFQYAQEAIRLGCLDYILKPITPQQITASIEKCIKNVNIEDLLKYELIDIFENQKILLNKKSITIRFTLLSNTHTLSSEEINDDLERLISEFEKNGYIVKR